MEESVLQRPSAQEMDDVRAKQVAYQYMCHLEEAKIWLEKVLQRPLPAASVLEENLRNGVLLARLGHFVTPEVVPLGSIYDPDQKRYETVGLNFRHTDNVNLWLRALQRSGFPRIFLPEVPDVFDRKNMPKVIYCIHALSAHLFRLGRAPQMQDLFGKINFTDDAISDVCKKLKDSGVVMPAFQNINGLFSKEIDPHGNSLECAIGAVNDAIDQGSTRNLLVALSDPALQLKDFKRPNIEVYLDVFTAAKQEKCETSLNKSLNGSYEADDSDGILTQLEIQGLLRVVNFDFFWKELCEAMKKQEKSVIEEILNKNSDELGSKYKHENAADYVELLVSVNLEDAETERRRELIQNVLRTGNQRAEEAQDVECALERLMRILEEGNSDQLFCELRRPCMKVEEKLNSFAAPLYFYELQEHVQMTGRLTLADVLSCISSLNLVAAVTAAVDAGDADSIWDALCQLNLYFKGAIALPSRADASLRSSYLHHLETMRVEKLGMANDLLTLEEIEECVDAANALKVDHANKLILVQEVNCAVKDCDEGKLIALLQQLLPDAREADSLLWLSYLERKLEEKSKEDQQLWLTDIVSTHDDIARFTDAVDQRILFLRSLKMAVEDEDVDRIQDLTNSDFSLDGDELLKVLREGMRQSPWVQEEIYGQMVYIDTNTGSFTFRRPEGLTVNQAFSTGAIKAAVAQVREGQSVKSALETLQAAIRIQSAVRGHLVRLRVQRYNKAAVTLQRWWRRKRQLLRKADGERFMDYYLNHMKEIKTIQDCWRQRQKRKASTEISPAPSCKNLLESSAPSDSNVGAFESSAPSDSNVDAAESPAPADSSVDAAEELIQKLRRHVMEAIKKNQELSKKVDDMDTKIGLLVRNRISITALMAERKNQKLAPNTKLSGIKSLSKDAKAVLDGYQKLFYMLQTRPEYLSRLITQSPSNLTIQSCILNLFNMGSSARDAYLLLRLFAKALHEEVRDKFRKPADAVTGNPLVLKLAVGFARQTGGQHPLQYILAPLIYQVLEETTSFDTNPVDIYRRWVNETEASCGCPSNLPRNVSQDVALSHSEVALRLQRNIDLLKTWSKKFLNRLSENTHRFPYALKFIAKTLQEALKEKFPDITEKDTLKIVGHLIYYQYVNSALVAPDAFHIITLPAQQPLRAEQRKNLASIAKILQFSASKNGFGEESKHLMQLNPFIIECHEVMKQISRECCRVPSLEHHYHVNQYSEALLLRRPRVYMTVAELCECHQLLAKQTSIVAPDAADPIHDVLDDLRDVPTPASLLGCTPEIAANIQVEKTLICLELDNEFLAEPLDEKELKKLTDDATEQNLRRESQNKELHDLNVTLSRLHEKTKHFEEQLVFYEKYMETCLNNLTMRKKKKLCKTVKYTGAQMIEKGILAKLDSVPANQLKNVLFEISNTDVNGRFRVRCRFMGVEVDTADIDIQHLLSLQFEGCGVMNMFGKAEVNVNLLIFLLNKKFIRQNCAADGK